MICCFWRCRLERLLKVPSCAWDELYLFPLLGWGSSQKSGSTPTKEVGLSLSIDFGAHGIHAESRCEPSIGEHRGLQLLRPSRPSNQSDKYQPTHKTTTFISNLLLNSQFSILNSHSYKHLLQQPLFPNLQLLQC